MAMTADQLPDDPDALKAMVLARDVENARLIQIIKELQRHRFGRRAETLPQDQLLLGLEEAEQIEAAGEEEEERLLQPTSGEDGQSAGPTVVRCRRIFLAWRWSSTSRTTPARAAERHHGSARTLSERLDIVPAQLRVIVVRRPKYACRACEDVVVQAPAPARLIESGLPTEATVAQVLVSKYADHLPLYRQAQIYARQGINLDRSTLADWVGRAAWHLRPVHERLLGKLKTSPKLFADETTAPVLDPGRGRTKTGQLWAYARDDRPWEGSDPPGVAYVYAPDRKAERPMAHLAGFTGILQVDGYGGYRVLAEKSGVTLAFCWAHVRRRFYELAVAGPAPIASEACWQDRRALQDRGRHPRPVGGRTPCRAPGKKPADHHSARALAAREARPDQPEDKARRGNPLHALALGRPDPLPRRRPHRDRQQHGRALHPSNRAQPLISITSAISMRRRFTILERGANCGTRSAAVSSGARKSRLA